MKRITVCLAVVFLAAVFAVSSSLAGHGEKPEKKTGFLLVAFGTSVQEAQASFRRIEEKVRKAHPDVPLRWAFTSRIVRNILSERGQTYDSPEVALARMMDEGFTHVAIQSLHTIPGEEFHGPLENARKFEGMAGGMRKESVGYPFLIVDEDVERVADALLSIVPEERKKDEAVVFMGHGTHHPANAYYAALM